mgnify:FL=1
MKDDDEWLGWISAMLFHAVGVSRTGTKALGHKRAYRGQNALLRWSVLGFFFVVVVVVVVVVCVCVCVCGWVGVGVWVYVCVLTVYGLIMCFGR